MCLLSICANSNRALADAHIVHVKAKQNFRSAYVT